MEFIVFENRWIGDPSVIAQSRRECITDCGQRGLAVVQPLRQWAGPRTGLRTALGKQFTINRFERRAFNQLSHPAPDAELSKREEIMKISDSAENILVQSD